MSRRQYNSNSPEYRSAVDEAALFGVARTLLVDWDGAGAGQSLSVSVPSGCNRALVKVLVTGGAAGVLSVRHNQQRDYSPVDQLAAEVASLAYSANGSSTVLQLPPGVGYLTASVTGLAGGTMDAEVIFWRED